MNDCIFCKIVNGEVPSDKVYEDNRILAFHDINPVAPVHVVVIPKEHIATFMDLKAEQFDVLTAMMEAAQRIARELDVDKQGFRIVINCNKDGGQVIFHLHMHIIGGKKLGSKMA